MAHTQYTILPTESSPGSLTVGLLDLPIEILREITDNLLRRELKSLRLVCSGLRHLVTPLIFTTAICALRRGVFDIFQAVANSPEISQCITEVIYDASWLNPITAVRYEEVEDTPAQKAISAIQQHAEFVAAFHEQEHILETDLVPALQNAVRNFPKLRRLVCADFSRQAYFLGDRVEDLGFDFRVRGEWPHPYTARIETDVSGASSLDSLLSSDAMFRRSYTGLVVLLNTVSEPDCKAQLDDLRIGDGAYSRGAGGVPDIVLAALPQNINGGSAAFNSLRNFDLTLSQSPIFDSEWIPSRFPHLECLRLVGPICSPLSQKFAPSLDAPVIEVAKIYTEPLWRKLKCLELRWITFHTTSLMTFLSSHRDTLQFINLQEIYFHEKTTFRIIASRLRSTYPGLVTESDNRHPLHQDDPAQTIINFTLHHGNATLIDMSESMHADEYDEDEISNYSAYEHPDDHERYSSEELDYSDGGDSFMDDEVMELRNLY
ncbi:MAG: hypothetical protein LQ352_007837 [Teloschistes flavicans]|nr:MAG: hypothetical protein LQ352_007837 [Teloschistes flavicans]